MGVVIRFTRNHNCETLLDTRGRTPYRLRAIADWLLARGHWYGSSINAAWVKYGES